MGRKTLPRSEKGKIIQALRGNKNLEEFAQKVGIHSALLSQYETGRKIPGSKNLQKIAQAIFTD